jgi:hypothetical protein
LQRAYLDLANNKINGNATVLPAGLPPGFPVAFFASSGDEKEFYRAELRSLNTSVVSALGRATDREAKAHLEAARDQIAKILDPKFGPASGAGANQIRIFGDNMSGTMDPFLMPADMLGTCWPDYVIRPE